MSSSRPSSPYLGREEKDSRPQTIKKGNLGRETKFSRPSPLDCGRQVKISRPSQLILAILLT